MNCADVTIRLTDLVGGRLPPVARDAVEDHLRHCPTCAAAAVSRAHAGDERTLWEHAGRATVRRATEGRARLVHAPRPRLRRAATPRPEKPIVLRRAPARLRKRPRVRKRVRLMQGGVLALAGVVLIMGSVHSGRWVEHMGLDRWHPEPVASPMPPAAQAPAADDRLVLLGETRTALARIADLSTPGPDLSGYIRAARLTQRLRGERGRRELLPWMEAALAEIEAFLIRAEIAGDRAEEWGALRTLIEQEGLIRTCADLRAGAELIEGRVGL